MIIAMTDLATPGAGLGGVSGVDIDHDDPPFQGLVFDEVLQLLEGPGVEVGPLVLSYPLLNPLPNVGQLLHHDHISCLEAIHNPAADDVIQVGHPSALPAREPSQDALSTLRAFGLEGSTLGPEPPPDVHSFSAAELHPRAGGCQVDDAQIDADDLGIGSGFWGLDWGAQGDVDVDVDIPRPLVPIVADGGCCGLLPSKQTPLVVADIEGELLPALDGGDRDFELWFGSLLPFDEPEEVLIEGEGLRPEELGSAASLSSGFDSPDHAGEDPDDVVCGKAVAFFKRVVEFAMQAIRMTNVLFQGHFQGIVTGLGELEHRLLEGLGILFGDYHLASHGLNELHRENDTIKEGGSQGQGAFPTRINPDFPCA